MEEAVCERSGRERLPDYLHDSRVWFGRAGIGMREMGKNARAAAGVRGTVPKKLADGAGARPMGKQPSRSMTVGGLSATLRCPALPVARVPQSYPGQSIVPAPVAASRTPKIQALEEGNTAATGANRETLK